MQAISESYPYEVDVFYYLLIGISFGLLCTKRNKLQCQQNRERRKEATEQQQNKWKRTNVEFVRKIWTRILNEQILNVHYSLFTVQSGEK